MSPPIFTTGQRVVLTVYSRFVSLIPVFDSIENLKCAIFGDVFVSDENIAVFWCFELLRIQLNIEF